jgi:hypothetical protein
MPRDTNQNYSLPEAPFVAGTVASPTAVNANFSDIALALTASLTRGETTSWSRGLLDDIDASAGRATLGLSALSFDGSNNLTLPAALTVTGGVTAAGATLSAPCVLPASDPTLANQAARKAYVDAQDALRLALIGGTLSGALILNADPSAALGAATKQYVDGADNELRGGVSAVIATTSGTAHDVVSIPSWANYLDCFVDGISLSGLDDLLIQLGISTGFVTTGYDTAASIGTGFSASTNGFRVGAAGSAGLSGIVMFARMTGNIWVSSHAVSRQGVTSVGGGRVDLGATLDRFRVTRVGTDTFDAGSFVLKWRR